MDHWVESVKYQWFNSQFPKHNNPKPYIEPQCYSQFYFSFIDITNVESRRKMKKRKRKKKREITKMNLPKTFQIQIAAIFFFLRWIPQNLRMGGNLRNNKWKVEERKVCVAGSSKAKTHNFPRHSPNLLFSLPLFLS